MTHQTILRIRISLRAGYTQVKASAQEFGNDYLTPLLNEIQELATDVRSGYRQSRDSIQSFQQQHVPHALDAVRQTFQTVYETGSSLMMPRVITQKPASYTAETSTGISSSASADTPALGSQHYARTMSEEQVNRNIVVAAVSVVLATAGLFVPVLGWLSIPGILYATEHIHKATYHALKHRQVGVDCMISLTVLGSIAVGYYITGAVAALFFQMATKLLRRVTEDARHELIDVFTQMPQFVWIRIDEGEELRIPFQDVKVGDMAVVRTGGTIPVDGTIAEGHGSIDQHILTGEAAPVEKEQGEIVFASTVVISGRILIHVEQTGQNTTVAKIGTILNETVDFKSTVELRAQTLSDKTVLPDLLLACVSMPFVGLYGALGIVQSHFKNQMTFVAPLSILSFFKLASKQGILIKDGRSLELLNQVDTLVFDKTGTLTSEAFEVAAIHPCPASQAEEVLRYAAAAESRQTHPIAQAILHEATIRQIHLPEIDDAHYQVGYGLTVIMWNTCIQVGSFRFMESVGLDMSSKIRDLHHHCVNQGQSLVFVAREQQLIGAIELTPIIRPEVKAVLQRLRRQQQISRMYIVSGDHEIPTRRLAQELGIERYFAETLPEHKARILRQLQQEGRFVCYVGDGINDAIALKQAHVSISLRGASTVATDTAQIVLLDQGLTHLSTVFELSRQFQRNQNRTFAMFLGLMGVGIGGVFLLGWGITETLILSVIRIACGTLNSLTPRFALPPQVEEPNMLSGETEDF